MTSRWIFVGLAAALGVQGCAPTVSSNAFGAGGSGGGERGGRSETFAIFYREDAVPVHRVLALPEDAVWSALPRAFRALGYPGGPSARPDERIFLTPYLKVNDLLYQGERNSVYLECGPNISTGLPVADAWMVTFAILVRLTPETGGGTAVDVILDGNAADRTQRAQSVRCSGTGRLENALLDLIERYARSSVQ